MAEKPRRLASRARIARPTIAAPSSMKTCDTSWVVETMRLRYQPTDRFDRSLRVRHPECSTRDLRSLSSVAQPAGKQLRRPENERDRPRELISEQRLGNAFPNLSRISTRRPKTS